MRALISLILIFTFILSCSSGPGKRSKRIFKQSREKQSETPQKKSARGSKSIPKTTLSESPKVKFLLPTIIHDADRSTMVLIDPRQFLTDPIHGERGTIDANTPPSQIDEIQPYYIDQTEITVEQFKMFSPKYDEKPFTEKQECPQCPAMGINWHDADKYCLWAGKRLPAEVEWVAAARGGFDRPLPWGKEFLEHHANLFGEKDGYPAVAPVASFPAGASPFGVLDMAGNVWEWVGKPAALKKKGSTDLMGVVKGGGWTSGEKSAVISYRNVVRADLKNPTFGFRCVKPALKKQPQKK